MSRDSDWLIETKLIPSRPVDFLVDRSSLVNRLGLTPGRVLSIVAAGGYGKSTLLGQWRTAVKAEGMLVGWLSLDESDRELGEFLAYVFAALHRSGLSVNSDARPAGRATFASPRAALATILALCHDDGRNVALILDDYHRASSPDTDRFLAELIEWMPANLTLVLSSRTPPTIPLSKVRAGGRLVNLQAGDLRFSDAEICLLLHSTSRAITPGQVAELSARTNGWPVLVQFARFWLLGGDGHEGLLNIGAADIQSYLSEQVLDQLPEEVRRFLLLTSPLETVSAPLATAVGIADAARLLGTIGRLPLPLSPVEGRRNAYRIHHLLRSFLMDRALDEGIDLTRVHLRAARWFAGEGQHAPAVSHALAAGDPQLAGEILERAGGWRLIYHRYGHLGPLIRRVHEDLPWNAEQSFPRLTLGAAILQAKAGDLEGAKAIFDRIGVCRDTTPATRAEIDVVGSLLGLYRDEFGERRDGDSASPGIDDIAPSDPVYAAIASNMKSYQLLEAGEYHQARHHGSRAIEFFRRSQAVFGEIHLYAHIGQAAFCNGRIGEAAATYETMRSLSVAHIGPESDLHAIASILSAEILYESNDLDGARKMVELALPQIERSDSWLDVLAAGYCTATRLAYHDDGLEAGLDVLDRAEETARRRGYLRLRAVSALERTRMLTLSGRYEAARRALDGVSDILAAAERSRKPLVFRGDSPAILSARLCLREGRPAEALGRLAADAAGHAAETASRRITVEILKALSEHALGREGRRNDAVRAAFRLSVGEPFTRLYLDEGPEVIELVRAVVEVESADRELGRFVDRLSGPVRLHGPPRAALGSPELPELNHRERTILALIAEGRSNKEIARFIDLGPDAVKYHAKKLFTKLGVPRRSLAAAKARDLGLVG